jgi:predicted metal-binding membrane protein
VATAVAARRTAWGLTGSLALGAWGAIVAWGASPWARFADHGGTATLPPPTALGVFVVAWVVMLAAMMLPTTTGLVAAFAVVVGRRHDRRRLLAALFTGYLGIWVAVGAAFFVADGALHGADRRWGLVEERGWLLLALALGVAGAYQFSAGKRRCLTRCRSPHGLLLTRWRGRAPVAEAGRIGIEHGWSCIGCCWALMLVAFAVGSGSLGWMLALTAAMTLEKTGRSGGSWSGPIGIVLLVTAAGLVFANA